MIHLCFSRTASASIPAISRFTRQILANAKTHPKPRPLITGLLRSLEQCSFSKRIRCGKKQHSYILDRMIRFQPFVHSNRWKNHAPRQCNRLAGKIRLTSKSMKNSRFQTENGCFMANLLFVDTVHHALTVWCIFLDPVLMHWDNGDRKDKTSIQQKE